MTNSFNWTSTFGSSQDPGIERRDRETLEREKEIQRLIEAEKEEEEILIDNAERIRQKDLQENPPLEDLEFQGIETKPEHWLLRSLGWIGDRFDDVDRAAGIGEFNEYNARQKILKPLSETHVALGILGEFFVPDTFDIATAGLAYIPKRFAKIPKVWAKLTKAMNADAARAILRGDDMLVDAATGMRINAGDFSDIGKIDNSVMMSKGSGGSKNPRRPKDWSDIDPRRPSDVDADELGEIKFRQQWEPISNEIDYDFSKVSKVDFKPTIKSEKGNTVPSWVGTPIVRNAEQFLKDNPGKNLNDFPLTKWDGEYWVPKRRTRKKIVNGEEKTVSYIGLDRWVNRKKFDKIGKAERRRMRIEQSEGVPAGTLAREKTKQLVEFNKKRKEVGRRPLSMSEVEIDHVNALKAYDMYTKDLPKHYKDEFKALLSNEALTTGDNIGNLKLREKSIHKLLWPSLKARLQKLGHKRKGFRSPDAQMAYYKGINPKTGETRIAEFAEAIHKIDEEGTDLMNDLLKPIPKDKKTIRVKKTTKDLLTEIFGGGEDGAARYRVFMDELKDMPADIKEQFILDAIENVPKMQ